MKHLEWFLLLSLILCTSLMLTSMVARASTTVDVTITSTPATSLSCFIVVQPGVPYTKGNATYNYIKIFTTPVTFDWVPGTTYNITALSLVSIGNATTDLNGTVPGGSRTQYTFASWSDGGSQSHLYTVPETDDQLTISYSKNVQYYVTVAMYAPKLVNTTTVTTIVDPHTGTISTTTTVNSTLVGVWTANFTSQVTPGSGWYDSGSSLTLTAPASTTDLSGTPYTFLGSWWVNGKLVTGNTITLTVGPKANIVTAFYRDPPKLNFRWNAIPN